MPRSCVRRPSSKNASRIPKKRPATAARLRGDVLHDGVTNADLVIEAIIEVADAKRTLYAELEPRLKPDALLTTNTSSIPLVELRTDLARPAQFAGLHYFNPVAQMPLVEIIRHDAIAEETERRLAAFCRAIDKLPVPVAGTPGFLVNRVLFPYMLEAMRAYADGIPGPVIDKAAVKFGMPMGPIELIDTVGLDVAASVGAELAPFLGLPIPEGLANKLDSGKRGKKDGQGFYTWEEGKPRKPEVPQDYKAPDDLEDRLILPLLNESVAALHDGVVADGDLLDAGVIFGTGFAPFRGGPIQYIRTVGADALLARLQALKRPMATGSPRAPVGIPRACADPVYIVCVGLSAVSVPARIVSILCRTASPSALSANCTPMPAARLPWAPGGVTHTTLPATGRRSFSSSSVSSRNTSSPRKYRLGVGTKMPPVFRYGM
jgi:3-hydroxyacyl-CoA dehydrogenase/enoyl-CoA hydratase/3-hydroxybutyryl-CoA epimerase